MTPGVYYLAARSPLACHLNVWDPTPSFAPASSQPFLGDARGFRLSSGSYLSGMCDSVMWDISCSFAPASIPRQSTIYIYFVYMHVYTYIYIYVSGRSYLSDMILLFNSGLCRPFSLFSFKLLATCKNPVSLRSPKPVWGLIQMLGVLAALSLQLRLLESAQNKTPCVHGYGRG